MPPWWILLVSSEEDESLFSIRFFIIVDVGLFMPPFPLLFAELFGLYSFIIVLEGLSIIIFFTFRFDPLLFEPLERGLSTFNYVFED